MKILIFFKKLLKFILLIIDTKKIIFDIGKFDVCANDVQAEKIRLWFQKILNIVDIKIKIKGEIKKGNFLIVSNHSSWLDIVILGSIFKTTFLSKIEVSRWPVIGRITTSVDMLFIDRGKKNAAAESIKNISNFISHKRNVTIFPEGTSSGGKTLLKFKPRLFSSCVDENCQVQCVVIKYPYKNKKIHPYVPFVRGNSLFFNIIKVLFSNDIKADITILEIVTTENKNRDTISNECYEIIKKNLEKNVN